METPNIMLLYIYLAFLRISVVSGSTRCSSESRCVCITIQSGGILANCSKLSLSTSPNFTADVSVIDLTNNQLKDLPSNLPTGLKSLNVSANKINEFGANPFKNVKNLTHLDMSRNLLKAIPGDVKFPATLKVLNLEHNRIDNFFSNPFSGLRNLLKLDISSNVFEINSTIIYKELFEDLLNLKELNMAFCGIDYSLFEYPSEALMQLKRLETLTIVGLKNKTFGTDFGKMKTLKVLKLGCCTIEKIDINYFDNLAYLEEFVMLHGCVDNYNFTLRQIDIGAFAKLPRLRLLDISGNRMLGLCGLLNITNDLPKTNIRILKANNVHCNSGRSTVLFIEDLKALYKTNITELYLDGNKLEMTEPWAASYLPKTLRVLSVADNRWKLGTYAYQGIENLTCLNTIDLRYQNHHKKQDLGNYWLCEDFYSIHKCEALRFSHIRHEWVANDTDLSKFRCPNVSYAQIVPTALVHEPDLKIRGLSIKKLNRSDVDFQLA